MIAARVGAFANGTATRCVQLAKLNPVRRYKMIKSPALVRLNTKMLEDRTDNQPRGKIGGAYAEMPRADENIYQNQMRSLPQAFLCSRHSHYPCRFATAHRIEMRSQSGRSFARHTSRQLTFSSALNISVFRGDRPDRLHRETPRKMPRRSKI